jgi:hypothetical protein
MRLRSAPTACVTGCTAPLASRRATSTEISGSQDCKLLDSQVLATLMAKRCHPKQVLELEEVIMTHESRRLAGILLIVLPTVMFGGLSILSLLIGDPIYMKNPLRQDLWRAGHAHCWRLAYPGAGGAPLRG